MSATPQAPVLGVTSTTSALDFGSSQTSKTLPIINTGKGTLTWAVTDDRIWLTVSPPNWTTTTETDTLTATVSRAGLVHGTYTGTISITSNGGSQNIDVTMLVPNHLPIITSSPITTDEVSNPYTYDVNATDGDEDILTYKLTTSPPDMTIDDSTGLISWTPTVDGLYTVNISVDDGNGGIASQGFSLDVSPPPLLKVTPTSILDFGSSETSKTLDITNTGKGTLIWAVTDDRIGLTVSPPNGTTTTETDTLTVTVSRAGLVHGTYTGTISITSNGGNQDIDMTMLVPDHLPVITSSPITTAEVGKPYTYDVNATDADGDTLTYSLTTSPPDMTIDDGTGLISWTPTVDGLYTINVSVDDGNGGVASQNFSLDVSPLPPTDVYAEAGDKQVTIRWSDVPGATLYNIYWSTSVSKATKTQGTKISPVSSPYTHTGRVNSTTYYYVVTAVNNRESRESSPPVSATPGALDTLPPTNTKSSDFINSGIPSTNSTLVTLSLSATDNRGVTAYYVSESSTPPSSGDSGWVSITPATSYSANVSFTLSPENGTKTVYVWFKDAAGNISTVASDSIKLDTDLPSVKYVGPSDGATNVSIGSLITLVFSEDMDTDTINSTNFFVNGVSGTLEYMLYNSGTDKVAIFSPSSPLSDNTTYTATITTGVKDLGGNPLSSDYSWSFTTASSVAFPNLYLISLVFHTLPAAGDIQYYRFNAVDGEHLFVQLVDDYNGDRFNLYIKKGSLPTASEGGYDYTGTEDGAVEIASATAGIYYIMVKLSYKSPYGTGRYGILVSTSFTELTFGQSVTHTLSSAGDIKYYQFNAVDGEHLFVQLVDDYNGDRFNLYIKKGSLPTASEGGYDYTGTEDGAVEIASATAGIYYIMVKLFYKSPYGTGRYTILVSP